MNTDMSPQAITERLRLASQLAALCLALGKARVASAGMGKDHPLPGNATSHPVRPAKA
jgi:hypothetical protein